MRFKLSLNEINLKVAELLKNHVHVTVDTSGDEISITSPVGLNILRVEIEGLQPLTDREWRELSGEIKRTLEDAKIRELSDQCIGIHPLRTKVIHARVNPLELDLLRKAAGKEHRTISEYVRMASLEKADQLLISGLTRREEEEKTGKSVRTKREDERIYG